MFCADYISAYIFHAAFALGSSKKFGLDFRDVVEQYRHELLFCLWRIFMETEGLWLLYNFQSNFRPFTHIAAGAASGFLGACSVYPFDFVRRGVLVNVKPSLKHSLSTVSHSSEILVHFYTLRNWKDLFFKVPYAAVYFGLYFNMRDPKSTKSQCFWAGSSALLAALAEIPFDKVRWSRLMHYIWRKKPQTYFRLKRLWWEVERLWSLQGAFTCRSEPWC